MSERISFAVITILGLLVMGPMFTPQAAALYRTATPTPGITDYPNLVGFNCQHSPYVSFAPEEDEFPGTCDAIFAKDQVCVTDASLDWLTPRECESFLRGEYSH